jgi:hypothetical protein
VRNLGEPCEGLRSLRPRNRAFGSLPNQLHYRKTFPNDFQDVFTITVAPPRIVIPTGETEWKDPVFRAGYSNPENALAKEKAQAESLRQTLSLLLA